ncbi:uncharacterized protein Z518_06999 [Rhinocladiella mackenziei CBS 650.93]|uniref:Uncharacterized protein n=1 Tax=Rhinocladiella mackenziei CBS 650.93 TaxID=1442369 RepID=A0A0D2FN24_9EURO|nr:uncharacterized protein Z518_06999 [Rhinocladiella mackenziei CBS 650.93]KIX03447.1 hypothetical protein Z518_06999 [Rhinocladiella mackenziei CBS 650.93]
MNVVDVGEVIHMCLKDDLHMNALMAAVTMRMQIVHNAGPGTRQFTAQQHAAKAIAGLRKRLKDGNRRTDDHALDMLFLAAYELYCFNVEGTRAHLQALKSMKAERFLNPHIRTLFRNIDHFTATASLSKPTLPITWQEHQAPFKAIETRLASEQPLGTFVGSAFFLHTDILDLTTLEIIQDIIACAEAAESCRERLTNAHRGMKSKARIPPGLSDARRPGLKCRSHDQRMPHYCHPPVGMMSSADKPEGSEDARKMNDFETTSRSNAYWELILGICAVGIVCAVDADDTEWCAWTFMRIAKPLGITTYADLCECLCRYLWLDNFEVVDSYVMANLFNPKTQSMALRTVIGRAYVTKYVQREKKSLTRITNRSSNCYRPGA